MEINIVYDSIKKPHHLEYEPFIKMRLPFKYITILSMIFFLLSISDIALKQFIYIKVWISPLPQHPFSINNGSPCMSISKYKSTLLLLATFTCDHPNPRISRLVLFSYFK